MNDPTERDMLLKDEKWILLEIKLLKKELKQQVEDLKGVRENLSKCLRLSVAHRK